MWKSILHKIRLKIKCVYSIFFSFAILKLVARYIFKSPGQPGTQVLLDPTNKFEKVSHILSIYHIHMHINLHNRETEVTCVTIIYYLFLYLQQHIMIRPGYYIKSQKNNIFFTVKSRNLHQCEILFSLNLYETTFQDSRYRN